MLITCSSIQGTQTTVESVFISRFTMNNIALKLQKYWTHKIALKIISKRLKQPNFFYSQPSTLPKEAPAQLYLSLTIGLSFMISFVAPTRLSTFYAYLITKIGNRELKAASLFAVPTFRNSDIRISKRSIFKLFYLILVKNDFFLPVETLKTGVIAQREHPS